MTFETQDFSDDSFDGAAIRAGATEGPDYFEMDESSAKGSGSGAGAVPPEATPRIYTGDVIQLPKTQSAKPPSFGSLVAGYDQLLAARLHPPCIVENLFYADLAALCAAGGTGKTTLELYQAICIALGRDLWGCKVIRPGKSLIVTAEDSNELCWARMRELFNAMNLSVNDRYTALNSIAIWDISGSLARLAQLDSCGNIQLTELADDIVDTYRKDDLSLVIFDPTVSFGPGERIVNDGEQAIVVAARRIIRGLGSTCVKFSGHTGKVNARNGAIDQYAGRGGTALPDGCRMVTILSAVTGKPEDAPEGFELQPGDSGFIMARAKLSYTGPQPNIWVRRRGFAYDYWVDSKKGSPERLQRDMDLIEGFIRDELLHGRKHTKNTMETLLPVSGIKITRDRLRAALSKLDVNGVVREEDLPKEECHGKRKTFLNPLSNPPSDDGGLDPKKPVPEVAPKPAENAIPNPPSLRERINGGLEAVDTLPPSRNPPKKDGGLAADWRIRAVTCNQCQHFRAEPSGSIGACACPTCAKQRSGPALSATKELTCQHFFAIAGVV